MEYICGFIFLSALFFLFALQSVIDISPEENRVYLDPLPWSLRIIWPMIKLISFFLRCVEHSLLVESASVRLNKAGLKYLIKPLDWLSLKIFLVLIAFLIVSFFILNFDDLSKNYYFFCIVLWFFPELKISELSKKRDNNIIRSIPSFIDFLILSLSSGLSFVSALTRSVDIMPEGALRYELNNLIREIRSGTHKRDALLKFSASLNLSEIKTLVSSIVQSEKTGSSLTDTLKIQLAQRIEERFQNAEKLALEAPVKMIFPLVVFIFPVTFIILFFPIFIKFMTEF